MTREINGFGQLAKDVYRLNASPVYFKSRIGVLDRRIEIGVATAISGGKTWYMRQLRPGVCVIAPEYRRLTKCVVSKLREP